VSTTSHSPSKLPNFLVIGAMKSGTTSLYHYLRHHPQVFMPETKEVNFFNPLRNWRRGIEWYEQHFQGAGDGVIAIGEASTSYTKFPWIRDVPTRIAAVLGEIRLIYLVRDPIQRMQSHYLFNVGTGHERRSIEEAFRKESMYLNISRYALQIEQYTLCFPRDRLLVIESRDLREDRIATLRTVFRFLGVDEEWVPTTIDREFYRSADRKMKPSVVRQIRRIPHVRRLAMYVPGSIKKVKHRLTAGLPTEELDLKRANLSEDLRERLRESLREDVRGLRSYMPDDFDGWGIA
jgi:hypothetical protein